MYILAVCVYNPKKANVSSIQIFLAQFLALYLRKVMLNAANFYLFGIIHTKCKYIYSIGGGFARGGDLPLAQIFFELRCTPLA